MDAQFLKFLFIGLASWRIASLLVYEVGPFSIFDKLRERVGLKPGIIEGFLPTLFSCIWCMTVWTTILAYLLWIIFPTLVILIASMTFALMAERIIRGN